jgi:D-alanine-D-alanine ligase
MGGASFERDFSLASGRNITKALQAAGHEVLPLDTTDTLVETLRVEKPDCCYVALHGKNGEDGTIQSLLEYLQIPYVGSRPNECRFAWNKVMLASLLQQARAADSNSVLDWPTRMTLPAVTFKEMGAATALDMLPARVGCDYPLAVLPAHGGSAMGVNKVESAEQLGQAILEALSFDDEVIIEPWIEGVELSVCILGSGDDIQALPPIEIAPKHGFFDTEVRGNVDLVDYYVPVRAESLCAEPARAAQIRERIEQAAIEVHKAHHCRDLSRVDLIWDGKSAQILEVNVSPGMTENSLFPMACTAVGITFTTLLQGLIERAIARKSY